jgi:hypothetical protein
MNSFEHLPLWERFKEDATPEHLANVRKTLEGAASLLDRVIETFPTFTLHNSVHCHNVARLIGELLGPLGLKQLTSLEAAIVLLTAYCHDLGMVFTASERESVQQDPEWQQFLDDNPEAFIAVAKATGRIPATITEWYCRAYHADRVLQRLHSFFGPLLKWGAVSIANDLGELCKSHNEPVKELYSLETNYLGQADLRFCAILLRLGDILDFDGSRSP